MKARIRKTGEVINIAEYAKVTLDSCDSYGTPIELGFDEVEILQERSDDIDWEHRRYELAKAAMQGMLSNPNIIMSCGELEKDEEYIAKHSTIYADALIAELKKGGEK